MNILALAWKKNDLLRNLVARELKQRYKDSVLGFLWSILTPLFMAFIYVFFLRLLARGVPTEEIIVGVFAWQFTMLSVQGGMTSITGNANLVKKVFFPRVILPLANVAANLINFLLSLLVQFLIVGALLAMKGEFFSPWIAALPLLIVYHCIFNLALALIVACLNVYFRDTQHLVGVLLSAWFFVSPVMYNLDFAGHLAEKWPTVFNLYLANPMAVLLTAYRAALLPDTAMVWTAWSAAGWLIPLALLAGAVVLFDKLQRYFADLL